MALIYNVYERENKIPNAKTPKVAVAYSRQIRQITTKELAEDISDRCTIHRADVVAVLDALSISAMHYLMNGFGVQLGELGSFSMRISCKSAPTIKEFKPELIKGAKVRYTPGKEMLGKLRENTFVNAISLTEAELAGKASTKPEAGSEEKPKNPAEGGNPVE